MLQLILEEIVQFELLIVLFLLHEFVQYLYLFDVLDEYVVEEDHVLFLMLLILFQFLIEFHWLFDLFEIIQIDVLLFEYLIQNELLLIHFLFVLIDYLIVLMLTYMDLRFQMINDHEFDRFYYYLVTK